MKKIAIIVLSVAAVLSCNKTEQPENKAKTIPFVFKASIENNIDAKASVPNNKVVWAEGDRVGLFVYKETAWPDGGTTYLTLSNGAGTSEAEFGTWPDSYDNSGMYWDKVAYFPYQRISGEDNATADVATTYTKSTGVLSVQYPDSYYCYTSGQSYIPLIADLSQSGETNPSEMNFKHIGGAVKVSMTGVPYSAKSIGMFVKYNGVNNNGITGKFSVTPVNAGLDAGKVSASSVTDDSSVWLNVTPIDGTGTRDIDFIFPVPTLVNPSLSFVMYDKNGLKILSKSASNQPNIDRAQMLTLSTPWSMKYEEFYLRGWINGADVEDNTLAFDSKGKIASITFTQDSYLYLYNARLNKAYIPTDQDWNTPYCWKWDSWDKSSCPKLQLPAGTYSLALTYNSDGSISLSKTAL